MTTTINKCFDSLNKNTKMKTSLREKIQILLCSKYPHFVSGDEIERFSQSQGAKGSAGRRRVQELAERGVIERGETEKGYVQYQWKPPTNFIPARTPEKIAELKQLSQKLI